MAGYLLAGLGLGVLCALWGGLQRWLARVDPAAPGVEGRCGSCGVVCEEEER
jgi:hypothetical protein